MYIYKHIKNLETALLYFVFVLHNLPRRWPCSLGCTKGFFFSHVGYQFLSLSSHFALSPARWHSKHTYLSSRWMLGTTQLKSILSADHIIFNNEYLKRAYRRQRMTNNNNKNKSLILRKSKSAFLRNNCY